MYILNAIRTPIGRLYGGLSAVRPDDLLVYLIKELLVQQPLLATQTEALLLGCANQAGEDNRNIARMAVFLSGLKPEVTALTINSLCASGMDAVLDAMRRIYIGENDLIIAGGVESMSRSPWVESRVDGSREDSTIGWRFVNPLLPQFYATNSMSQTAELLADKLGISRQAQDEYAYRSRQLYQQEAYRQEILPIENYLAQDEQARLLPLETLQKLPSIIENGKYITMANSARIGDGAALLVLASERFVRKHGLVPMAKIKSWGVAATHPDDMGLTPIYSSEKALKNAEIAVNQLGRVEMSESFAVQALACQQALQLPLEILNPNGGEIAMGKPLGSCGARLLVSLAWALQKNPDLHYGLAATCAGLGVGTSVVLEAIS